MRSLPELQDAFAQAIFSGDGAAILPFVTADGVTPQERLAVYRNNVFHNFREALRAVYPVVDRLVGSDFFDYVADAYSRRHPSASGDIHGYGDAFADFLAGLEQATDLAYLPDTARLEWAIHRVFHAAAAPPIDPRRLAAVGEEHYASLRFVLNPACRLLASDYPVQRIWALNQPDVPWDEGFSLAEGGVHLLVRRDDFEVECVPLAEGEFQLLRTLAEGLPLGEAVARAQAADDTLTACLRDHLLSGTLSDFAVD